jgi:hypothetical protein
MPGLHLKGFHMEPSVEEKKQQRSEAIDFLGSLRGNYIVGQALAIAIQQLESVHPPEMRELSNISDMKYLAENLFSIGYASHLATEQYRKNRKETQ